MDIPPAARELQSDRHVVRAPGGCYDALQHPDGRLARGFGEPSVLGKMKILAGNSNRPLAEAIAAYLGEPLTGCHVRRFADLEIFVEILENVRGRDAFIIQSTSYPANDNLMELLIMIDALQARVGAAHHRGHSLFRLRPPGSQSRRRARRSRPSSSPISSPAPAPTGC